MNKSIKSTLKRYIIKNNISCIYCGRKYNKSRRVSADHLISKEQGGTLDLNNIAISCDICNSRLKRNMSIEEFILTDPRIKDNIKTYLNKIKKIIINGESYYDSIKWLEVLI